MSVGRAARARGLAAGVPAVGACTIAALAIASSIAGLMNGFTYDDRPIILQNPRLHHVGHLLRLWTETYWPPWMGAALYRPLSMSAFALEWWAGHGAPWIFHATNVLLYAAVAMLVLALARSLLSARSAWVVAALFAVHPVHVEAVANIVGQSELWAAVGVLGAVVLYLRGRRAAMRADPATRDGFGSAVGGTPRALAIVVLVAAACFSKEHAIIAPILLALAEVECVNDERPWSARWRVLRPLGLALLAVVVVYLAARALVIGALPGDRPHVVLEHLTPIARRWTALGIVPEWVRLFLWPARLSAEYAPRDIVIYDHLTPALLPALLLLVALAVTFIVSVRRWRIGAFALAWMAVTLVLVSNLVLMTGVLLAERTLFLPSVGAMLLVGAVIERLRIPGLGSTPGPAAEHAGVPAGSPRVAPARAAVLAGALGAVVLAGAWRSAVRQAVWRSNATLFAQAPLDAPLSYRAHDVFAGLLFDAGDLAGGEREARTALALYPHDPVLARDLAHQYIRAGLCRPAVPLLQQSVVETGTMETDARLLLAECLLAAGDRAGARAQTLRGVADGQYANYGPAYHRLLIAIDSAAAQPWPERRAGG